MSRTLLSKHPGELLALIATRRRQQHRVAVAAMHAASLPRSSPDLGNGGPNKQKTPGSRFPEVFTDQNPALTGVPGGCCPHARA